MKPGQIKMIFGDPVGCQYPIGLAVLDRLVKSHSQAEIWEVHLVDRIGKLIVVIKKESPEFSETFPNCSEFPNG